MGRLSELFCIVYDSCAQRYAHIYKQFLNFGLILFLVFCLQCFDAVGWAAGRAFGM